MSHFKFSFLAATMLAAGLASAAFADDLKPLNSDSEPDRMDWSQLDAKFGPMPKVEAGIKVGGVAKALTNEYWRSLGEGYVKEGTKLGVTVDLQAGQGEAED